jgi:rhodanese-related sulfurtransferase
MVKGFEEVKTHSEANDIQIIDCRPASMYLEAKIPNSININGIDFQNDNGTIKTDD